jgi:hypothetical protein
MRLGGEYNADRRHARPRVATGFRGVSPPLAVSSAAPIYPCLGEPCVPPMNGDPSPGQPTELTDDSEAT